MTSCLKSQELLTCYPQLAFFAVLIMYTVYTMNQTHPPRFVHLVTSCRTWLWKIARGISISGEEVEDRLVPKSDGCGKSFPGVKGLKNNSTYVRMLPVSFSMFARRISCF
jgi:hypothetical protein